MNIQVNEIAKIFADPYTKTYKDPHMKSDPRKHRKKNYYQLINKQFTDKELNQQKWLGLARTGILVKR